MNAVSEQQRQVVECKFFGGMTEAEIGEVLGLSARTVGRAWVKARAWLYRELYPEGLGMDGTPSDATGTP